MSSAVHIQSAFDYVMSRLPEGTAPFQHDQLLSQAEKYWQLLARWNAKIKLTGAQSTEMFATRHLADSLFGLACFGSLSDDAKILDIGAGAGFPGVPLAMVHQKYHWDLAESHVRRCAFLSQLQRTLGLSQLQVHPTRIDGNPEAEGLSGFQHYHRVLFRAVAPEQILPLAGSYLHPEGKILYWGTQAEIPLPPEGLTHHETFAYQLPDGESFAIYVYTHATI